MKVPVLVLVLYVCFSFGQTQIDRLIIDDFQAGEQSVVITIPASASFPIVQTSVFTDVNANNLLGGERDLRLTAESGSANRILVSQVNPGEWNTATPNSASGFALMQWDGLDNDANDLDNSGLGGIDITDNGLGNRIHAVIETDVATEYTFSVYSPNGGTCDRVVQIPGTQSRADYFIPFSEFTGNCDFTNVGAIEILIEAFDNVDSIIFLVAVNGDPDPITPTRTPTPSRNPDSPSSTPTPSGTPSPSIIPPMACMCHCPAFTCELVFDPDDDENNVYYFDDDDNGNASGSNVATSQLTGGNGGVSGGVSGGISGGNSAGGGDSGNNDSNSASFAQISVLSLVAVAFALF